MVVGFRWPAAWGFVLLTKVTPGVGLLWFAVRREWNELATALVATGMIVAVSAVFMPGAWSQWFTLLSSVSGRDGRGPRCRSRLMARLPVAVAIVVWGATTNRRWTVPVAGMVALPALWYGRSACCWQRSRCTGPNGATRVVPGWARANRPGHARWGPPRPPDPTPTARARPFSPDRVRVVVATARATRCGSRAQPGHRVDRYARFVPDGETSRSTNRGRIRQEPGRERRATLAGAAHTKAPEGTGGEPSGSTVGGCDCSQSPLIVGRRRLQPCGYRGPTPGRPVDHSPVRFRRFSPAPSGETKCIRRRPSPTTALSTKL